MLVTYTNINGITFNTYSKRVPLIEKRDLIVKEVMHLKELIKSGVPDIEKFNIEQRIMEKMGNVIRLNRRIKKIFE